MKNGSLIFGLLLACSASAAEAACDRAGPFAYRFQLNGSAAWQDGVGADCVLHALVNGNSRPLAAAVAHYRRRAPLSLVRYSFTFDAAHLQATNMVSYAQLFTILAATPVDQNGIARSQLVVVGLGGPIGGVPGRTLYVQAQSSHLMNSMPIEISGDVHTVRLELSVGAGTAGRLAYWLDADFAVPPTGTLDAGGAGLDNGAWGGAIGASIGLGAASPALLSHGMSSIDFSAIETTDDQIFWGNFDADAQ